MERGEKRWNGTKGHEMTRKATIWIDIATGTWGDPDDLRIVTIVDDDDPYMMNEHDLRQEAIEHGEKISWSSKENA
jgi:hypothetical protein